ncbi:peptidylprolyl isomerase [Sphingomonas sp.]|uniref:peptidylprolyl isomerase n=1 Tax=Sphingomonas sp. TaxID=28214 RepID=UPI0025FFD1D0|nr:peptidylprolyl isomerase [Sphingomonas sp.]
MTKFSFRSRAARVAAAAALIGLSVQTWAQTVPDGEVPQAGLDIPANLTIFGKLDPNIRKPTAIVNGTVITGTDVDQRMAFVSAINNYQLNDAERDQFKLSVLRLLIDETLEIQQAQSEKITISREKIDLAFARIAQQLGKDPATFASYLRSIGSSERSVRRQIEGELAWQSYLRRTVDINVSDDEVKAVIDRMAAAKGTEEYHLREIYMSATPESAAAVNAKLRQAMEEMKAGKAPFGYYARTLSETTTAPQEGELGWVRPASLPPELAQAAAEMQVGQLAGPIPVSGGFSVIYMVDKRTVMGADPRGAKLSLKQIKIAFPAGTTEAQAQLRAADFGKAIQGINGCGAANKAAAAIGAQVVDNDQLTVRDLPPPLQDMLLKMQVGQVSPPFGSPTEGISALVLCGRDDAPAAMLPSAEQVQDQMVQQRTNLRATKILRDLRRDAIIEYR